MLHSRRPLILASVVAVAAFSLLAAGCGGGNSPAVATVSTTTTAAGPSAGASTHATGLVAFASCMRSHGLPNFPDPNSSGGIPKQAVVSAFQAVSKSQADAAQNGLQSPAPGRGAERAARPNDHPPRPTGLPQGSRLHALARFPRLPRPDIPEQQRPDQHPVEHQPELFPVHERGDDLHQADPGGSARQPSRQSVNGRSDSATHEMTPQGHVLERTTEIGVDQRLPTTGERATPAMREGRGASRPTSRTSCARRWRPNVRSSSWHLPTRTRMWPAGERSARTFSAPAGSRNGCSRRASPSPGARAGRSGASRSTSPRSRPTRSELTT